MKNILLILFLAVNFAMTSIPSYAENKISGRSEKINYLSPTSYAALKQELLQEVEAKFNQEFDSLVALFNVTGAELEEMRGYQQRILADVRRIVLREAIDKDYQQFAFYPVAGSPMHLGHLMAGIAAKALYHMDQSFFRLQGIDERKPYLIDYATRERMLTELKDNLSAAIGFADNDRNDPDDGEHGLFRKFLREYAEEHPGQKVQASYMAGGDHANIFVLQHDEVGMKTYRKQNGEDREIFIDDEGVVTRDVTQAAVALDAKGLPKLDTIGKVILFPYLERKDPKMKLAEGHSVTSLTVIERQGYLMRDLKANPLTEKEKLLIKKLLIEVGEYTEAEATTLLRDEIIPKFNSFTVNVVPATVFISSSQVRKTVGKIRLDKDEILELEDLIHTEEKGIYSEKFIQRFKAILDSKGVLTAEDNQVFVKMPYSSLVRSILSQKYYDSHLHQLTLTTELEFDGAKKLLDLNDAQQQELDGYQARILDSIQTMDENETLEQPEEDSARFASTDTLEYLFYPMAASPMHLGHFMAGLIAKAKFGFHQAFARVQGRDDRKPDLLPYDVRINMHEEIIAHFLRAMGLADNDAGDPDDGEHGMFRRFLQDMARRFPGKKVDASYMAGGDHGNIFVLEHDDGGMKAFRNENGIDREIFLNEMGEPTQDVTEAKIAVDAEGSPRLDTIGKVILFPYLEQADPLMRLNPGHRIASLTVIERQGYLIRDLQENPVTQKEKDAMHQLLMRAGYNYQTALDLINNEILPKFENFKINVMEATVFISSSQVRSVLKKINISDEGIRELKAMKARYGVYSNAFIQFMKTKYIDTADLTEADKDIILKLPYSTLVNAIVSQVYVDKSQDAEVSVGMALAA